MEFVTICYIIGFCITGAIVTSKHAPKSFISSCSLLSICITWPVVWIIAIIWSERDRR